MEDLELKVRKFWNINMTNLAYAEFDDKFFTIMKTAFL